MALQARTEFAAALNQIASEKGVDVSVVVTAIEQAALAAYRKDLSLRGEVIPEDFEELVAKINPSSGEISILRGTDNITPPGFARIAAQTAKQVIAQKLHEAEKGAILDEYDKKVGTVISGTIQRQEGSTYYVDLGSVADGRGRVVQRGRHGRGGRSVASGQRRGLRGGRQQRPARLDYPA
jgi:N utilization substance protein A